jgi:hypothetical protein
MKCLFRILVFCSNDSLIHALKLSAPNTLGVQDDDVDFQAGDPFGYESADSLDIINQIERGEPFPASNTDLDDAMPTSGGRLALVRTLTYDAIPMTDYYTNTAEIESLKAQYPARRGTHFHYKSALRIFAFTANHRFKSFCTNIKSEILRYLPLHKSLLMQVVVIQGVFGHLRVGEDASPRARRSFTGTDCVIEITPVTDTVADLKRKLLSSRQITTFLSDPNRFEPMALLVRVDGMQGVWRSIAGDASSLIWLKKNQISCFEC